VLGGSDTLFLSVLLGAQSVVPNKRPGEPAKPLLLSMALFRFRGQRTDFLLTLNTELEQNLLSEDQVTAMFSSVVNSIKLPSRDDFLALFE